MHRDGDVVDRDLAQAALEGARVGVAVQDHVGVVLEDRRGEAVGAEERPDLAPLALERRRDGRVVQQDDPERAHRDRAQALVQRRGLLHRLGVDAAQGGLAEVGEVRAREAAHEALGADDPDLGLTQIERISWLWCLSITITPASCEHGGELVGAVGVPVVVAEHGQDRDVEVAHGVGDDRGLLGLAVGAEVAGQQDDVGALVQARRRPPRRARGRRRARRSGCRPRRRSGCGIRRGGRPAGLRWRSSSSSIPAYPLSAHRVAIHIWPRMTSSRSRISRTR